MRRARTCPWIRIRPYRVLLRGQGVFFAAQSSADCITNMSGFDLRQAQASQAGPGSVGCGIFWDCSEGAMPMTDEQLAAMHRLLAEYHRRLAKEAVLDVSTTPILRSGS